MAFNLSQLSAYTDENSFELIGKAVLNTSLMEEVEIRTGLAAGTVAINLFDADLSVADRACGWDSAGSLTPSQVDIIIRDKQVKQELCPTDLREFYLSQSMKASANDEEIPFEEIITDYYVRKISEYNEDFLINGDASTDALANFMTEDGGANFATGAVLAWTTTNAYEEALKIYNAVDEKVIDRDDIIMVMSPAKYRTLTQALAIQNLFHFDSTQENQIVMLPGTNCKVVKSSGLVGSDQVFAGPAGFIVAGTGLEDDASSLDMFFDKGEDVVKLKAVWRLGVAVSEVNVFGTNIESED